ncbi:MAG TPA: putative phage abortive infection protein, partial [Bacteroidia bacterium]|nr:putative phage abortive infection protein [Bacteroidia bacterium]
KIKDILKKTFMETIVKFLKLFSVPIIIVFSIIFFAPALVNFFTKWFANMYYDIFPNIIAQKTVPTQSIVSQTGNTIDPAITGQIGDTFGGTLGPVIATLAAFLTFLAFWVQYRANQQQENYIKQQRFEDAFFRLLDHHKKNVDSMDVRETDNPLNVKAVGYECFRSMYLLLEKNIGENKQKENVNNKYDLIQKHFRHDLHHYFRFLYHILKFIKQSDISEEDKFKYTSILRASLSAYEIIFIFCNCLHENGNSHFKPLVEEFSFLKNRDDSLIFNLEQKKEYDDLAFASSSERPKLLKEWKIKQRKN